MKHKLLILLTSLFFPVISHAHPGHEHPESMSQYHLTSAHYISIYIALTLIAFFLIQKPALERWIRKRFNN